MFRCPVSGAFCFLPKPISITQMTNNGPINCQVCESCTALAHEQAWQSFVQYILKSFAADKILTEEEFKKAVVSIKTKQELTLFLNQLAEKVNEKNKPKEVCKCGLDLRTLLQTKRIGCSECYQHFREFIEEMIYRTQVIPYRHEGKRPKGNLQALEDAMAKAVKEERYEEAAKIRDTIKTMKNPSGEKDITQRS